MAWYHDLPLGPADTSGNDTARAGLGTNAAGARGFAQQGAQSYANGTQSLGAALSGLQQQASGERSLSREMLRQGLQQNLASQNAMAASAAPQNQAMAARTAMIQGGRLASGLAGQQTAAGLQEQNQAQQSLVQGLLGQRGQDMQATLGGYGASTQAGAASINEENDKSWSDRNAAILTAAASAGKAASDERLKRGIVSGAPASRRFLDALQGYSYEYKPGPAASVGGAGRQLGVMAQDVEKVLPGAVTTTPAGKVVDTGKFAMALGAAMPDLHQRLKRVEAGIGADETLDPYARQRMEKRRADYAAAVKPRREEIDI